MDESNSSFSSSYSTKLSYAKDKGGPHARNPSCSNGTNVVHVSAPVTVVGDIHGCALPRSYAPYTTNYVFLGAPLSDQLTCFPCQKHPHEGPTADLDGRIQVLKKGIFSSHLGKNAHPPSFCPNLDTTPESIQPKRLPCAAANNPYRTNGKIL